MNKQILPILAFLMFQFCVGCNNQPPEKNSFSDSKQAESENPQKFGRKNFAVIWEWATDDTELVNDNILQMSTEFTDLWKRDIVENAYFDNDSNIDKLANFANIVFFLKSQDEQEAKSILDQLTVVTNNIATYILHPVGPLWLDRKTDLINEKGITKSYATVWTTLTSPLHGENADKLLKQQSDTILELWNAGSIENVYFDIEGTYSENSVTDFVFFVNANSEAEAKSICESLPFYKEKMASYEIHQAGIFWMGKFSNQEL